MFTNVKEFKILYFRILKILKNCFEIKSHQDLPYLILTELRLYIIKYIIYIRGRFLQENTALPETFNIIKIKSINFVE